MCIFYILSICVWTSVAMATRDQQELTDTELVASPLIQNLLERVENLEKQSVKQQEEIQTLRIEVFQQRGDMTKLRTNLRTMDRIIQTLHNKNRMSDMDRKLTHIDMKHADTQMAAESNAHNDRRPSHTNTYRIRPAENDVTVAFSASLTQSMLQVGDKQNLVFDNVITNVGQVYNSHHGVFIAPVSCVYVFFTSVLSYDNRTNYAYMTVNGIHKSQLFLRNDVHDMASQMLVVELTEGDDVAIHGHAGDAYHGHVPSFTTFSGFLLQQNYPNPGNNMQIIG